MPPTGRARIKVRRPKEGERASMEYRNRLHAMNR